MLPNVRYVGEVYELKIRIMLKPKKGFLMAHLNVERLTPLQWDGIMRAMDDYANHYHEELSKFHQPTVINAVCCENCSNFNSNEKNMR